MVRTIVGLYALAKNSLEINQISPDADRLLHDFLIDFSNFLQQQLVHGVVFNSIISDCN